MTIVTSIDVLRYFGKAPIPYQNDGFKPSRSILSRELTLKKSNRALTRVLGK